MDTPIKNITDLRNEIQRLKGLQQEQSTALAERFRSPSAMLQTVFSLFSGGGGGLLFEGIKNARFFDQDLVGLISRFVLPFTLNKTLFRKSNFLIKAIVSLVSQKASHFINEDVVIGLWDKIKPLFAKKQAHPSPLHENTPTYSEVY